MILGGFHYQVLRTSADRQYVVCTELLRRFPEDRGRVFIPKWENYRRDTKSMERKAMFTGYIFVHTDLKRIELYEYIKEFARPVRQRLLKGDPDVDLWTEKENYVYDMTEDEEAFFDTVLDHEGIERMSRGYVEPGSDGKPHAVVMEGPLVQYGNRIIRLDKRNWLAWLDMKIGTQPVMAGLHIEPKEVWFPDTA